MFKDDPKIAVDAERLWGQALLAEGAPLPAPAAFGRRIAELVTTPGWGGP